MQKRNLCSQGTQYLSAKLYLKIKFSGVTLRFACCNKQRSEIDRINLNTANKEKNKENSVVKSWYLIVVKPIWERRVASSGWLNLCCTFRLTADVAFPTKNCSLHADDSYSVCCSHAAEVPFPRAIKPDLATEPGNVSWRRHAQIKRLAWPMADRQIRHQKSSFSPFRALSRRQITFPFCCLISLNGSRLHAGCKNKKNIF